MSTPQTSWSGPALTGTAPDNRLIGFVLLAVSKICPLHTRMGDLRRRRVSGSRLPAVARRAWRAAAATRAITRPCQVPLCDGRPSTGSPCPLPGRSLPALPLARRHGYGMPGRPVKGVAAAGTYRVTGRSPLMQSGQMICSATAELRVSRGQAAPRHRGLLDSLAGAGDEGACPACP